ncbi:putative non-specific lipid-transfer protein 3 [Triticum urartu]|uniref:Non-specific lipid-transfer protein n=1 Tax=Triticum urartu TaxID=4572 RepID=M8A104_TRIUA|nr:putative non-specific lipid-transfer protein 3 [Triticum urartu]
MVAAVVLAAVVLMMAGREASAALSCGQVDSKLAPCVAYVTGRASSISKECCSGVQGLNGMARSSSDRKIACRASSISKECCSGVQGLNGMARSSSDRKIACRCLKSLATSIKSINMGKVSGVPGKCGVSVPFPISMSTNCDTLMEGHCVKELMPSGNLRRPKWPPEREMP